MGFTTPVDHKVKMIEREKIEEYYDLARNLKSLWIMKVTVITITVDALGTVPTCLENKLTELKTRGRIEASQNSALIRSEKILNRVLETRRHLLLLRLQ